MSAARPSIDRAASLWSAALAVVGGVAWALCFAREPSVLLPWLALAPLVALLGRRRPALWCWLFGAVTWLVSLSWLVPTVETFGGLPRWLSVALFGLLCAYLALDQALFGWVGGWIWRRAAARLDAADGWRWVLVVVLALPSLWLLLDWKRGMPIGVFPWNATGTAWIDVPGALETSAWIGGYGLAFLAMVANAGLAVAVTRKAWRLGAGCVLGVLLILLVGGRFGALAVDPTRAPDAAGLDRPDGVRVVLVQPNNAITHDEAELAAGYRRLLAMSEEACTGASTLLVWPESASWPYGWDNSPRLRRDLGRLAARGCTVVINAARQRVGRGAGRSDGAGEIGLYNSALLVERDPTLGAASGWGGGARIAGEYSKRHLVPYGEYVPLREVLPFVGTLAREAGSFTPGTEPVLLDYRGERIAMSICYEVIFPQEVAELVREGGTILASHTNDAWYGDSWAPWQHLRAARLRAAEMRRPMVRAALTGVSALIDGRGRVVRQLGVGERGMLETRIVGAAPAAVTPYARAPAAPLWASVVLLAFAIIALRRTRPPAAPR